MMRSALVIFAAMFAAPAVASECDALVAKIVEISGASVVKFPTENEAILRIGDDVVLLDCRAPSASMSAGTAFPSDVFFKTLAAAGSSFAKADAREIEREIRSCQDASLRQDGFVGVNRRAFTVDCLFTRDKTGFAIVRPNR